MANERNISLVEFTGGLVTAIVLMFGGWLRRQSWLPHALALADALGIGAYGVVGMHLAVQAGIPMIGAMLIGFVNAVGGGVLRDLLLNQRPAPIGLGRNKWIWSNLQNRQSRRRYCSSRRTNSINWHLKVSFPL